MGAWNRFLAWLNDDPRLANPCRRVVRAARNGASFDGRSDQDYWVNPATGAPMISHAMDVTGQTFGGGDAFGSWPDF